MRWTVTFKGKYLDPTSTTFYAESFQEACNKAKVAILLTHGKEEPDIEITKLEWTSY